MTGVQFPFPAHNDFPTLRELGSRQTFSLDPGEKVFLIWTMVDMKKHEVKAVILSTSVSIIVDSLASFFHIFSFGTQLFSYSFLSLFGIIYFNSLFSLIGVQDALELNSS